MAKTGCRHGEKQVVPALPKRHLPQRGGAQRNMRAAACPHRLEHWQTWVEEVAD